MPPATDLATDPAPQTTRRDTFSEAERSEVMRRIRRKDTRPELELRRELTRRGFRYRIDYSRAAGRPDVALVGRKIAIFVDGEFWHGKKHSAARIAEMSEYWQRKIRRNVERDIAVNRELTAAGWTVIRVTDRAIARHLEKVADFIQRAAAGRYRGRRAAGIELHRPS